MALNEIIEIRRRHDDLEQRFLQHESHIEQDRLRWEQLMQEMKITQETVADLAEATRNLRDSTSDLAEIIEAWRSVKGVQRAGSAVGRFVQWLSGFAVVGAIAAWFTAK